MRPCYQASTRSIVELSAQVRAPHITVAIQRCAMQTMRGPASLTQASKHGFGIHGTPHRIARLGMRELEFELYLSGQAAAGTTKADAGYRVLPKHGPGISRRRDGLLGRRPTDVAHACCAWISDSNGCRASAGFNSVGVTNTSLASSHASNSGAGRAPNS